MSIVVASCLVIRVQAIKRLFSGGPGQFEVGMDGWARGGLGSHELAMSV